VSVGIDKLDKTAKTVRSTTAITVTNEEDLAVLDAKYCFRYLLVFNACLESYAHGSNDTANATGAFTAVVTTFNGAGNGMYDCGATDTPVWLMVVAGFFVFLGITTFGENVINTIGKQVTFIDFHRGFYVELGSTFAVVVATLAGMPVSTTHCQVGGLFAVGIIAEGWAGVTWGLLGFIAASWVITLPLAGGVAALLTTIFRAIMGASH